MNCPHCGAEIDESELRSVPQLRRYFALVRRAYHHWPEAHPRQFASETDCRIWLQMQAGHFETGASFPLRGLSKSLAVMMAESVIRAAGSYAEVAVHGDCLVVRRPKSIAFHKLGHKAACQLFDAVAEVIMTQSGLDPERLLAERAA